MKSNPDSKCALAIALEKELEDILKRRSDLIAERNRLLGRAQEEEAERPGSLAPAEMRARADSIGQKIVAINTGELTPLKKRIRDAFNKASHDRLARTTLERLLARVVEALRPFGTEGEVNLSPEHERSLLMKLRNAKTKSQRDEINAGLRKIRLHRRFIENHNETEKAQEKETPDALFKKERKRQKKRKKALRCLKKLEARGSQQSE